MRKSLYFFLFIAITVSLSSCFGVKKVEVKQVESVKVLSMTDSTADLAVCLRVENPNNMKIQVKSCDVDAYLNKKLIGKVKFDETITLPKKSESSQTVILKADMKTFKKIAPTLLFSSKALINLKGNVNVKAMGIKKKIPVEVDQKISKSDLQNFNMTASKD